MPALGFQPWQLPTPGSAGILGRHGCMNRKAPAGSFVPILKAGKTTNTKKPMKDQILLTVEELEERIAPDTVGALHNNPSNPNNNNDHNAVPKGALPEAQGGN